MDNFDVSNFDLNAILRGAQLTLVGGEFCRFFPPCSGSTDLCTQSIVPSKTQACSHPTTIDRQPLLWQLALPFELSLLYLYVCSNCLSPSHEHPDGRNIILIPDPQIIGVRVLLWILSLFMDMDHSSWDETVVDGLHYFEHTVLQVPFFLMTLMRYITPTLDRM